MQVKWLLEDVDVKTDVDRLISAFKRQKTEYKIVNRMEVEKAYDPDDCVIAYGSLQFIDRVMKYTKYIPGSWIDFRALQCHRYLTHLSKYSIHSHFGFFTVRQLIEFDSFLAIWSQFQVNDKIFIKPNDTRKAFSGTVIDNDPKCHHEFVRQIGYLDPEMICLVAAASDREIQKEYRFIATEKGIITGCQYEPDLSPYKAKLAELCAADVASDFFDIPTRKNPYVHPVTVDIAVFEDGSCSLVELGGFNVSGLYKMDYNKLVRELNILALDEWTDYDHSRQ